MKRALCTLALFLFLTSVAQGDTAYIPLVQGERVNYPNCAYVTDGRVYWVGPDRLHGYGFVQNGMNKHLYNVQVGYNLWRDGELVFGAMSEYVNYWYSDLTRDHLWPRERCFFGGLVRADTGLVWDTVTWQIDYTPECALGMRGRASGKGL